MRRILLRTALVLLLLFVFAAGTLLLIHGFMSSRLERYKRDLRAKGEKFLISELSAGPVVSNTMIPRLAAANKHLPDSPYAYGGFSPMSETNGMARIAWAWKTNLWPKWQEELDHGEPYLREIRAAVKLKPRTVGWDYQNYESISPILEIRKAGQWLVSAAIIELNRDRRRDALTNLIALIDLAQCDEQGAIFTFQMIRIALADLAMRVTWEALQQHAWHDEDLRSIQEGWSQIDFGKPLQLSLRMERAVALDYFEMARRGKTIATDLIKLPTAPEVPDLYTPLWRVALSSEDELVFVKNIQTFIDAMTETINTRSARGLERKIASVDLTPRGFRAYRIPMSRAVTPDVARALKRWIRIETLRQMALAAVALERYRARTGQYPQRLGELVPGILPSVPVDFGDGQPIRYERQDTSFRLWSVTEGAVWSRAE